MPMPRVLGFLALAICWLSIAWGYGGRGQWWGVLAALVPVVGFGIAAAGDPQPDSALGTRAGGLPAARAQTAGARGGYGQAAFQESFCLVAIFCVSAAGILAGAGAFPMTFGATAALAAWDLLSPNRPTATGATAVASATARRYERKRELFLALALASGLLLAAIGKLLVLRIPFVLVVLLVLLDVFSLDRLSRYLRS